jgi:UDP-N-acetylglucosamine--N-acetylmuramyl-(pentapeptide) pyrophosphoryl-undecaprenol N-acetylglucosamine transferase
MSDKQTKILLTGGGTGGSVTPLLAIAEELRGRSEAGEYNFLWVGTRDGIEKGMVEKDGIIFRSISAGKLRRYFAWQNFLDPFRIIAGFFQSFSIILKWKPDMIISAGSFVATPVIFAGWLARVPIIIHQLDARPGLSNRLAAPFARAVTVTFEKTLAAFGRKAVLTGNPIRPRLFDLYQEHRAKIKTDDGSLPVVLVLGGGTGAQFINGLIEKSANQLTEFCELIHLTGKDKNISVIASANYQSYEFLNLEEMAWAYAAADIVVSRAGMGTLTELARLGKPTVIIPIPDSHQEENAQIFHEARAAIVLEQNELTPELFNKFLHKLVEDKKLWQELSANIKTVIESDSIRKIIAIISQIIEKKKD